MHTPGAGCGFTSLSPSPCCWRGRNGDCIPRGGVHVPSPSMARSTCRLSFLFGSSVHRAPRIRCNCEHHETPPPTSACRTGVQLYLAYCPCLQEARCGTGRAGTGDELSPNSDSRSHPQIFPLRNLHSKTVLIVTIEGFMTLRQPIGNL